VDNVYVWREEERGEHNAEFARRSRGGDGAMLECDDDCFIDHTHVKGAYQTHSKTHRRRMQEEEERYAIYQADAERDRKERVAQRKRDRLHDKAHTLTLLEWLRALGLSSVRTAIRTVRDLNDNDNEGVDAAVVIVDDDDVKAKRGQVMNEFASGVLVCDIVSLLAKCELRGVSRSARGASAAALHNWELACNVLKEHHKIPLELLWNKAEYASGAGSTMRDIRILLHHIKTTFPLPWTLRPKKKSTTRKKRATNSKT
jgi:hypothetical protein